MKKQLTVRIDLEVIDKIRDIVYWNPEFTMNGFIELTLKEVVNKFDNVKPRPTEKLQSGRKIS